MSINHNRTLVLRSRTVQRPRSLRLDGCIIRFTFRSSTTKRLALEVSELCVNRIFGSSFDCKQTYIYHQQGEAVHVHFDGKTSDSLYPLPLRIEVKWLNKKRRGKEVRSQFWENIKRNARKRMDLRISTKMSCFPSNVLDSEWLEYPYNITLSAQQWRMYPILGTPCHFFLHVQNSKDRREMVKYGVVSSFSRTGRTLAQRKRVVVSEAGIAEQNKQASDIRMLSELLTLQNKDVSKMLSRGQSWVLVILLFRRWLSG